MPIYEYVCMKCEGHFEELVSLGGGDPHCPDCDSDNVRKLLSSFAATAPPNSPASADSPAEAAVAAGAVAAATDASNRQQELAALAAQAAGCERCRLAQGRTQVVFGSGDPDAELMLVGEAPGFHEDRQGLPFVGAAGALLDRLLGSIGWPLRRLRRRRPQLPPARQSRSLPDEIEPCEATCSSRSARATVRH
jgi:putative FmdB family regulatory protein